MEQQYHSSITTNIPNNPVNNNLTAGISSNRKLKAPMMPKGTSFADIVPHTSYCWKSPAEGPCFPTSMDGSTVSQPLPSHYELLVNHPSTQHFFGEDSGLVNPKAVFPLNAPNNRAPCNGVRWNTIIYTTGAHKALEFYSDKVKKQQVQQYLLPESEDIPPEICSPDEPNELGLSRCAHFYFNGECKRGFHCGFFHPAHIDPQAFPGQVSPKPKAVPAKASYLEAKGLVPPSDRSRQNVQQNYHHQPHSTQPMYQQQVPMPFQTPGTVMMHESLGSLSSASLSQSGTPTGVPGQRVMVLQPQQQASHPGGPSASAHNTNPALFPTLAAPPPGTASSNMQVLMAPVPDHQSNTQQPARPVVFRSNTIESMERSVNSNTSSSSALGGHVGMIPPHNTGSQSHHPGAPPGTWVPVQALNTAPVLLQVPHQPQQTSVLTGGSQPGTAIVGQSQRHELLNTPPGPAPAYQGYVQVQKPF